jgi:hypothetical protein
MHVMHVSDVIKHCAQGGEHAMQYNWLVPDETTDWVYPEPHVKQVFAFEQEPHCGGQTLHAPVVFK